MTLRDYINLGLLSERSHPTFKNLRIFNYTPTVQYDGIWDDITLSCRGLVYDVNRGEVVARPFKKFFNMEELSEDDIPKTSNFQVYNKFDGSLGILFNYKSQWIICTRGSFTSDQALKATEMLEDYKSFLIKLDKKNTYLFEIIYPENDSVVDYGDTEMLMLLAAKNTKTGEEQSISPMDWAHVAQPIEVDKGSSIFKKLKELNTKNQEGFVIHFPDHDFRFKIKFEDYFKLHRLMFNFSNRTVWKHIRDNGWDDINTLIKDIPDEYYNKINKFLEELKYHRDRIYNECVTSFRRIWWEISSSDTFVDTDTDYSKEFAFKVKSTVPKEYHSILFAFHRKKDYEKIIIKMIKPEVIKKL